MKTVAKIFIIIGMVVGFWMIVPIIVGSIALNKLASATKKEELTGIGICTLLFCNVIGGVLMLCIPESEFVDDTLNETNINVVVNQTSESNTSEKKNSSNIEDMAEKLSKLKELKDSGAITEEEYSKMKSQVLAQMK